MSYCHRFIPYGPHASPRVQPRNQTPRETVFDPSKTEYDQIRAKCGAQAYPQTGRRYVGYNEPKLRRWVMNALKYRFEGFSEGYVAARSAVSLLLCLGCHHGFLIQKFYVDLKIEPPSMSHEDLEIPAPAPRPHALNPQDINREGNRAVVLMSAS